MSIETLKNRLPEYAKDLKLNLSSLAVEASLSEQQRAGTFVASAIASRNTDVTEAVIAEFGPKLSPECRWCKSPISARGSPGLGLGRHM